MIPAAFDYHKASSVAEAVGLLKEHGMDAKILAGGHSLIPAMKLRLNQPGILIDISGIADLSGIKDDGRKLIIGANTTHGTIAKSADVASGAPILAETAGVIGDVQIRNKGTIGGSIAHADPAADWPAALIASNASIEVMGGGGNRTIAASDFFTGIYDTALEDGEVIVAIHVPKTPGTSGSAYAKFFQPASRFAIVGCAAILEMKDSYCVSASVAFTGVADAAFLDEKVSAALAGQTLNDETIKAASAMEADGADILGDHFASAEYRQHLAKVFAERAIRAAMANA